MQPPVPGVAALAQRWLRVGDVARKLGVSANTVRRWTDDGRLLSYRSPGGHRRYLAEEIAGLIVAQPGPVSSAAGGPANVATQLRVLVELGNLVAEGDDLSSFVAVLASRLREAVGASDVDIWRLQDGDMRCLVSVDENGVDREVAGVSFKADLFPEQQAAFARGEVSIRPDLSDPGLPPLDRAVFEDYGYRNSLSAPIIAGHGIVGIIDLYDREQRDWSGYVDFVTSLTQTVAGSFKNAVLREELERRNAAQRELLEIGDVLAKTADLEAMLGFVGERLLLVTGATSCDVFSVENEQLRCLMSSQPVEGVEGRAGQVLELADYPLAQRALADNEPLVIAGLDDPLLTARDVERYRRRGSRGLLSLPLIADDRRVGLIDIEDKRERDFAEHLDFARSVGQLLSSAFAKAFLLARAEAGIRELRQLVDAGLEFGASLDVGEVLLAAASRMRAAEGLDRCDIYAIEGDYLEGLVSTRENGMDPSFPGSSFLLSECGLGLEATATRRPMPCGDVLSDPRIDLRQRRAFTSRNVRACLILPLVIRGDVIGLAIVSSSEPHSFVHVELLRALGHVAAQAMANANLHRQLHRSLQRTALMNESSLELSSSLELDDIVLAAARRLCSAVDTPDCAIVVVDGDTIRCLIDLVNGEVDPVWTGREFPASEWPTLQLVQQTGKPFVFTSLDDPRLPQESRRAHEEFGEKSGIMLPLIVGSEVFGAAELLESRYERVFTEGEVATAEAICRVAALAIDNATLFTDIQAVNHENALLNEIAQKTAATLDATDVAAAAVGELRQMVPFDRADVMTVDGDHLTSVYSTADAPRTADGLRIGTLDQELLERFRTEPLVIFDHAGDNPEPFMAAIDPTMQSAAIIGLRHDGRLIGSLCISSRAPSFFRSIDKRLLARVGTQLSLAMKNARLYDDIKRMHLSNLKALSSALSAKDHYTLGHAARVSSYMVLMGRALGWPDEYVLQAEEAAYLHDIGKIGISDRVLLKPSKLNSQEWALMRQHPVFSADIIHSLFDEEFVAGVRHHHERYDGGGYPEGLRGTDLPLIARAMGVVDSYDAMSFQRPYRPARSHDGCLEELRACRGRQFDPEMVDVLLSVLDDLKPRQEMADAVAHEAAAAIDPHKYTQLREPDDMARAEYAEIVAQLRAARDANPPTRFVTTYATVDNRAIVIADSEEDPHEFSALGDELIMDINIEILMRGITPAANTLSADQFGVWITGIAPILDARGEIVGAVTADLPPFDSSDAHGVRGDGGQTLASMLQSAAVRLSRAEIDAITDGLTGLYNHRYLHERLDEELERAAEQETSLSVLFADLDHFKKYNDELGHSAGDRALRNVAQVIEQSVRRVDLAARYGGEEFVAVLIDTDGSGAREVAERIRAAIRKVNATPDRSDLTISIGISTFPDDGIAKEELLDKADWAMYLAKRRGRDRVETFGPADIPPAET